jgi:hypothetical protein
MLTSFMCTNTSDGLQEIIWAIVPLSFPLHILSALLKLSEMVGNNEK